MLHGLKLFQVKQLTLEQSEEIFCYRIVQAVSFAAHALPDSFGFKHLLVLLVLVLPPLVRVSFKGFGNQGRIRIFGYSAIRIFKLLNSKDIVIY